MTNYRRKKKFNKVDDTKKFAINRQIKSPQLKVIDEKGEFIGLMSLSEALMTAEQEQKDLVEINPKDNPPVAKIVDYSKFKYLQEKEKKPKKTDNEKAIRVSVRISDHDIQVQTRKIDVFIEKKMTVRLQVQMERREKQYPALAVETMNRLLSFITKEYIVQSPPKLAGDSCLCQIKFK